MIPNNKIRTRNSIEQHEHEDSANARRVLIVDADGDPIDSSNKLPVEASFNLNSLTVEIASATSPIIYNLNAALANTEYSIALPDDTRRYVIKARNASRIQFSFQALQSNTNFITIKPGNSWSENDLKLDSKVLYFRVSKPNTSIELLIWT